jgi:vacuolar protein-sorting-associated protein 4
MNNTLIPQAVEIVTQAIEADNNGDYQTAFQLYHRSLDYFVTGLKYEQNPTGKLTAIRSLESSSALTIP